MNKNTGPEAGKYSSREQGIGKGKRERREWEYWAFKQDNAIVRRKDYSSVMLCSMRENPMRINLSPGDEGFTRCNIFQITSHHSDPPVDMSRNLHKTASFSASFLSAFPLILPSVFSLTFIFQLSPKANYWHRTICTIRFLMNSGWCGVCGSASFFFFPSTLMTAQIVF